MAEIVQESPLMCDLTAITGEGPEAHVMSAEEIFGMATALRDLEDGYAIQVPNAAENLVALAKFIVHERECCPFFRFEIQAEAERGPVWLKLSGREGVKELVRSELLRLVNPAVAQAANLH